MLSTCPNAGSAMTSFVYHGVLFVGRQVGRTHSSVYYQSVAILARSELPYLEALSFIVWVHTDCLVGLRLWDFFSTCCTPSSSSGLDEPGKVARFLHLISNFSLVVSLSWHSMRFNSTVHTFQQTPFTSLFDIRDTLPTPITCIASFWAHNC